MEGWNDEEVPTEEFIKAVDIDRDVREIASRMRKEQRSNQMQMILRTTICFKDFGKFSDPRTKKLVYGDRYSGNHVAIFECQLKAPPPLALIDHNEEEFFSAYRINFRNWRIVDIDNFMGGNSFFDEKLAPSVFDARMDKYFGKNREGGDVKQQNTNQEDPNHFQNYVEPAIAKKYEQFQFLDTKANRNMSPLHKMRAEMLAKKKEVSEGDSSNKKKKEKKAEKVEEEK